MNNNKKEIETFINNLKLIREGKDECSSFTVYKGMDRITLMLDDKNVSTLYVDN